MSSIKLPHSSGNSMSIAAPATNPAADRTINLNDDYAGNGSFVLADTNGDVGLGTAPNNFGSYKTLHIKGPSGEGAAIRLQDNGDTADSNDAAIYKNASALYLRVNGTDPVIFYLNGSEASRFTSNGSQFWFCDTEPSASVSGCSIMNNQGEIRMGNSGTDTKTRLRFYNANGQAGSITTNGSATAYNTSSDYRLKENQVVISDGITRVKTLKPYRFNFKKDPTKTVDGFFAHEVTAVPEAITGTKDATTEDGSIDPQGIDQSKLVPLLTAALQEAITKIETLETKVAALEAG